MRLHALKLPLILLNPAITRVPVRVLRSLNRSGKRALSSLETPGAGRWRALKLAKAWLDGELITRHRGQWVINSFLPPFPGKAFDRLFENLLSGRHLSPVSAFLAVTSECPYDCWHCSMKTRAGGERPTADWLRLLGELTDLGVSVVGFTGGEPLTRPDLPELVAAAASRGAAPMLFTTGFGLDAPLAKRLKDAGLWALCVSLDSHVPEEHDRGRGHRGAFDAAVAALRLSRATGFYTMSASVASCGYVEEKRYLPLYALARSLGVQEFRIVEPMPCGKLKDADSDALLTPAHVDELRRFHVETNRKGGSPKVCAFNHVESPELFGCGGGTQHLFIDAAGEVCPCDFTPLSFGNAFAAPLEPIWLKMNQAMGDNPRRHCFIQRHHKLVQDFAARSGEYPLPPELSCQVCEQAGSEPLPDYFAMITAGKGAGK